MFDVSLGKGENDTSGALNSWLFGLVIGRFSVDGVVPTHAQKEKGQEQAHLRPSSGSEPTSDAERATRILGPWLQGPPTLSMPLFTFAGFGGGKQRKGQSGCRGCGDPTH